MNETITEISSDKMVLQVKGRTVAPESEWRYVEPADIEKIKAVKELKNKWADSM